MDSSSPLKKPSKSTKCMVRKGEARKAITAYWFLVVPSPTFQHLHPFHYCHNLHRLLLDQDWDQSWESWGQSLRGRGMGRGMCDLSVYVWVWVKIHQPPFLFVDLQFCILLKDLNIAIKYEQKPKLFSGLPWISFKRPELAADFLTGFISCGLHFVSVLVLSMGTAGNDIIIKILTLAENILWIVQGFWCISVCFVFLDVRCLL
jgi:hypothetical protein